MLYILALTNLILSVYLIILITKTNHSQKETKTNKRAHAKLAKASFTSPLDPYEQYKDKNSGLYEPRRAKGGIRIEVDKE